MYDVEDVLPILKDLVALKGPNFIYQGPIRQCGDDVCVYWDKEGAPSCLVGWVLDRLDLLDVVKRDLQNESGFAGLIHQDKHWTGPLYGLFTDQAAALLSEAQDNQDTGHTWAMSVALAKKQVFESRSGFLGRTIQVTRTDEDWTQELYETIGPPVTVEYPVANPERIKL